MKHRNQDCIYQVGVHLVPATKQRLPDQTLHPESGSEMENSTVELADRVFEILKRRGPMCESQLSAELVVGLKSIATSLEQLEREGIVERRPDHDQAIDTETAWGLRKPFKGSLAAGQ